MENKAYKVSHEDLPTIEPSSTESAEKIADDAQTPVTEKKRRFTIEPVMMIYMAAFLATKTLDSQYVVSVMMREYNVSGGENDTATCGEMDSNSSYFKLQQEAQASSAQITLLFDLTQGIPAMAVALFFGSYKGRHLALILPTIGLIVHCLGFVLQQSLHLPLLVTIIGTTLDGLTGSKPIMITACYAYISDTVSKGNRTSRIMICECMATAFMGILQLAMGHLIRAVGYRWPYLLLISLHIINIVYILFFVPESRAASSEGKAFNPYYIIESMKTVMKKRNKLMPRSMLVLCLLAFALLTFGQEAQYGIENIYLLNAPLCMDSVRVGYWKTVRLLVQSSALLLFGKFILPKLGYVYTVVISCLSVMAFFIVFPLVTEVWQSFAGGLISVLFVVERASTLVAKTAFNTLYAATLTFFRGMTHMSFAVFTGIGMIMILIYKWKASEVGPEGNPIVFFFNEHLYSGHHIF